MVLKHLNVLILIIECKRNEDHCSCQNNYCECDAGYKREENRIQCKGNSTATLVTLVRLQNRERIATLLILYKV